MTRAKQRTDTVSGLEAHIGFWMRFVSNHVSHSFARRLLASGVTVAEWVVLREMFEREAMPPSELAAITGLTRGAVSKLVDRLVAKRLIHRQEARDDRRFQSIALTVEGRRVVPKLAAQADANDAEFFAVLTTREREALTATLKKLVEAHALRQIPME